MFCGIAVAATLLVCAGTASFCQAQTPPQSPAGAWDCVTHGGGQSGLAYINFDTNGSPPYSLSGYELLASTPVSGSNDGGRNPGGGAGRGDSLPSTSTSTNGATGATNVFGFGPVSGSWAYDEKGRVIGNITYQIESPLGSGNYVTNAVSFVGKVVPGKRLTLVASTSLGRVAYRGVPTVAVTDSTGSSFDGSFWQGLKKQSGVKYQEFFSLSSAGLPDPNIYNMVGSGPGYTYYSGICMISSKRKIGFSLIESGGSTTNGLLRATVGSFVNNNRKSAANTKGVIEPDTKIHFNAVKY